jgi:hypothetical protein
MTRVFRDAKNTLREDEVEAVNFMLKYLTKYKRSELSEWEIEFLSNIEQRMQYPHPSLTPNQYDKLQEVFGKH